MDRLLSLGMGLLLACAWQASTAAEGIEDQLRALMEEHGTVGLAVAVVRDNAVVHRSSLGWKDLERKIPLEEEDVFRIASISKSFAAVSVLQLAEQGRLSLDDEAGDLIGFPVRNPAFPERPITLRMLLNHTSSITDGPKYGSLDFINPDAGGQWQDSYADRAPGERYEYSNLAYNMVGAIVERASGERFDAYVKRHVLEPLGLYGGHLVDALDADRIARIYRWREGEGFVRSDAAYAPLGERLHGHVIGYDAPVFSPTGGLKISAPDLAKYMLMHMNQGAWNGVRILGAEHAATMQEPTVDIDGTAGYGLAIRTERALVPGVVLTGHTGSAYGLYSSMFFDAEAKYGFVVMTNGTRDTGIRDEVNRALYEHFIDGAALAADAPAVSDAATMQQAGMVDIRSLVPDMSQAIAYATSDNFVGAPVDGYLAPRCWLKRGAAGALARVEASLRARHMRLHVFDCYRPVRAVAHFMRWVNDADDQATKATHYPDLDKPQLLDGYIAQVSGHSRGHTIDLTLLQCDAGGAACEPLDMGTTFDFFGPRANTDSPDVSAAQRANRHLLRDAMQAGGFGNYPMEWWHYSFRSGAEPGPLYDVPVN
ncbi:hypothetical protein GCM10011394_25040 [Luteimonas terricola]|uniref:D-alanyl-D-alanine dipeptidase n=1 Tax=Luteimonas terricola TaxID=645597 RepID=A0ABQ2EMR2_9GAMM|nr:hypothetical protein GCM10011394_25040 [Luteimonas terricola]